MDFWLAIIPCSTRVQCLLGACPGVSRFAGGNRYRHAVVAGLLRRTFFSEAIHRESGAKRTANNHGEFRFDDLSPAPYVLIVKAAGFADAQSTVTVVGRPQSGTSKSACIRLRSSSR